MRDRRVVLGRRARRGLFASGVLAAAGQAPTAPRRGGNPEAAKRVNPVAASPESIAAGRRAYNQFCANCHGSTGKGDGNGGAAGAAAGRPHRRDVGLRIDRRRDLRRHSRRHLQRHGQLRRAAEGRGHLEHRQLHPDAWLRNERNVEVLPLIFDAPRLDAAGDPRHLRDAAAEPAVSRATGRARVSSARRGADVPPRVDQDRRLSRGLRLLSAERALRHAGVATGVDGLSTR